MPTSADGWPVTPTYSGLFERLVILIDERASAGVRGSLVTCSVVVAGTRSSPAAYTQEGMVIAFQPRTRLSSSFALELP